MKCKNCEHDEFEHVYNEDWDGCIIDECDCKQFISQEKSRTFSESDIKDSGSAFILSDKRKELIRTNSFGKSTYCIGWNDAIKRCNEQDAEFIRLIEKDLKDKTQNIKGTQTLSFITTMEVIKKRAGRRLTEGEGNK